MEAEATTLSMMANMALGMIKPKLQDYLNIPTLDYPDMKKCFGVKLMSPTIELKEAHILIGADFKYEAADMDCIMGKLD